MNMENERPLSEFVWLQAKRNDLVDAGLFNEALDVLDATIEFHQAQDQSSIRYVSMLIQMKADTYRKMKRYDEAIEQYKQAHSVEASDFSISSIAECYWLMGDHKQAATEIAKITMPYMVTRYEYWKQHIAEREGHR